MTRLPVLLSLALLPLTACVADDDGETLTVFAAASLTAVFAELEEEYEERHPGIDVRLSFGGSADLAAQIQEGAEADVFASADRPTMDGFAAADATGPGARPFATNTLVAAVPPGNPRAVASLADLAADGLDLVVCAPEVPCGRAARRAADLAGVTLRPASEEQSVTDVLAKVRAGEADAGLVYLTDVRATPDDVEAVVLPELAEVVNECWISVVDRTTRRTAAEDFVDLLLGDTGRQVLDAHGFGALP